LTYFGLIFDFRLPCVAGNFPSASFISEVYHFGSGFSVSAGTTSLLDEDAPSGCAFSN